MTQSRTAAEIRELGQRWADAELHGDASALDTMLAADFTGVGPRGFVLTKEQWLQRYRSGDLQNTSFGWSEVNVRTYGDVAVAIGVQDQVAAYNDRPASGRFRVTLVLIRESGNWMIASAHISGPLMSGGPPPAG